MLVTGGLPMAVRCTPERVREVIAKLEAYCRERQWAGIDPYDALNSPLFERTPLGRSQLLRLAATQLLKRSPVNLRPLLGIRPHQNPKALALFLMAYVRLARQGDDASRARAVEVANRLLELRSPDTDYWCWGYSFPWQMRHRLVPRFAPNLVCTTFVAEALLDAHEFGLGDVYLEAAVDAGRYIRRLFWQDGDQAAFAYPLPDNRVPIHNANFLAAALLCRLAAVTGDRSDIDLALAAARFSVLAQRPDGSWPYGADATQQWVDNFHTGFNLCALQTLSVSLATAEFDARLEDGLRFYLEHFFRDDGAPKYFHDHTYPIDIHSVAQSVVTLGALGSLDPRSASLRRAVLTWAFDHMRDEKGFFYYRRLPFGYIRTSYMRWAQAWMLLALTSASQVDGLAPSGAAVRPLTTTHSVEHRSV